MAARVPFLRPGYKRAIERLSIRGGSDRAKSVAAAIRALTNAAELPTSADTRIMLPPTGSAWCRRVGPQLWLVFSWDAQHVFIITLTNAPPVPAY